MIKKSNIWTTINKKDRTWETKREGNPTPILTSKTQKEADKMGREIAKKEKVDLITQGRDGRIVSHDSFGNDPNPPKDKEH